MARRCVAIADHVGKTDDDLTFIKGDVIFVNRVEGDRMQGVFKGKVGWFNKVFVDDTTVEIKEAGRAVRVRAIRPYKAEQDDHLSFPLGAVMFVVKRVDDNFFLGVYEGKQGLIPSAQVEDADAKPKVALPDNAALRCKAIRTHVNEDPKYLCFAAGDIVFVPKSNDADELWQGVCKSQVGLFPKSYVMDTKAVPEDQIEAALKAVQATDEEQAAQLSLQVFRTKLAEQLSKAHSS